MDNLRLEDRKELDLCLDGSGLDPVDAVLEQWRVADICEAILTDTGAVAGVWGVHRNPLMPQCGLIWMLGTPLLPSVTVPFLRECPRAIGRAHALYEALACTAWRENSLHLTWLDWCGFTRLDPGYGHFIAFTYVRPSGSTSDYAGGSCGLSGCTARPAE